MSMPQSTVCLDFVEDVVPHLDAAYNLARWLTRNDQDAQDVVQEASATPAIRGYIRIVRNTLPWNLTKNSLAPILLPRPQKKLSLGARTAIWSGGRYKISLRPIVKY
jgi:hypothetical protein